VKRVLLISDDNCVSCVVAALVANNIINAIAEQIGSFTLAFVAPLSAKKY
jgi:hypothetical protein